MIFTLCRFESIGFYSLIVSLSLCLFVHLHGSLPFGSWNNLGQALLDLDEFSDAIVHLLDSFVFGETQSTLVRDVVNTTDGFSVLSCGSTN